MSSRNKTNAYSASNVNTVVIQELAEVADIGVYGDLTPLVLFVRNNHLIKALSNISYFSSVNDIGQVAKNARNLSKVLEFINYVLYDTNTESPNLTVKLSLLEERERIVEFYADLCTNHLKIIYKFYGMRKPLAVIALTGLLLALVEYKNHSVLTNFQDSFDFNHSTLPKILVPTRDEFEKNIIEEFSMRYAVMELWIAICMHSNSSFKKSLLTNFKVMNNFWKHVEMERYETLSKIIKFLDKHVLCDPSFKRSTKCQILNENFLYNFRNLFALVKNDNERKEDNDMNDFDCFKKDFKNFMNVLVSDQAKGITYPQNEFGSPMVVNKKTFKINNKLIYTLLTALKPWDSHAQLQYCLKILNSNLELVAPYMNWIVTSSGGYHDPSLTSYWIGHTLLYSEILKSPSLPVQSDMISLVPLSKNALTECLSYPSNLVKQLGSQLVLLQLNKVTSVSSPLQLLVASVLSNIPTQASFVPLLIHDNKLIKLTATMIIKKIESLIPTSSSAAVVSTISQNLDRLNLEGAACDSFELVLLDNYLSIQSNNDLKWWNKASNGNSFFTSLLKLSKINFLKTKVYHILEKLTRTTFIFGKNDIIESTLLMLIESVARYMDSASFEKLWNCFDESISRSIKLPYKYLDRSHIQYDDVSVFVVALFEQLNYVPNIREELELMLWLQDFATRLVIVGESQLAIVNLAKDNNFELAINLNQVTLKENIISKYDLAEAIIVLNQSVLTRKESQIFELFTKVGAFLSSSDLSNNSMIAFISNPQNFTFIKSFSSKSMSGNEALALTLFSELLQQLGQDFSGTKLSEFVFQTCMELLPRKNQMVLSRYFWLLSDDQITTLSSNFENDHIVSSVFKVICLRGLKIVPDFEKLLKIETPELEYILNYFKTSITDFRLILSYPSLFFLLDEPSSELSQYLLGIEEIPDNVLYRVAPADKAVAEKFKNLVVNLALSLTNWTQSLRIFTKYCDWFERDALLKLCFSYVEDKARLTMTAEFTDYINLYVRTFDIQENDLIKLWLQRAMIYINKKFAESPELSANFDNFLDSIESFITKYDHFRVQIHSSIMNTQFEVLFSHSKWISHEKYLSYSNKVLMKWNVKDINSDKLLQLFVANENNALRKLPGSNDSSLRFQTALLVYVLYNIEGANSHNITLMNQLLSLYLGSSRAEDLLLKNVLISIEGKVAKSWVSNVTNWDFIDELSQREIDLVGEERLIINDKSNLVVALNKSFVTNTVRNMIETPSIPRSHNYDDFLSFFAKSFSGKYLETVYDPEFLILVILNNEELVTEEEGKMKFILTKIIDSGLLQFIVNCLALAHIRAISKVLLHGILKYINNTEENFKDKNLIKIYVSSILHTLRTSDHTSSLVWYFIGEFANIITNPGHFLYERVSRYVLSTPIILPHEIPLYKNISMSLINEDSIDEDNYYKQVTWLIELLTNGIKSRDDLKLLRFREVVEWALNVSNLPYSSSALKSKVLHFINEVQSLLGEGTDSLVTKFAGFASLEILKRSLDGDKFSATQQALNIDQIALRTGIVAQTLKRVREWSNHRIPHAVKRIHKQ